MKPDEENESVVNSPLSSAITTFLESGDENEEDGIVGGILEDADRAWLANGAKFVVVELSTGSKIAAWSFGNVLRDVKARVACVAELPARSSIGGGSLQLLVGLECELIGGMVCLFHCNGSHVLRAIKVDCQITSLRYVHEVPGSAFDCFDGIVMVGAHGGGAYVFDLDWSNSSKAILDGGGGGQDEIDVVNTVVLSMENINIIAQQRSIACTKDHHIAVQINEESMHSLQFVLYNPDNTVKLSSDRDNIFVTSLAYVPQISSAVVGFNIGVFQIWNLVTLTLEFTSQTTFGDIPISHISFLEPCDDPRAFCYLWIVHSNLNKYEEGFPLAIMYSLTYQGKVPMTDSKYLYQQFTSCNLRFNIELSNINGVQFSGKDFIGGRCLDCRSVTKTSNVKDDADEYALNICQIVWECWTLSAVTPIQSAMLLFDIDQWYKEQMPDICDLKPNNFMTFVNLEDILPQNNSYLCDVKINASTLTSYTSVQRLEEHFYPNAIGYECWCLSNTHITKFLTMGVQRQLLSSINEIGPSVLLNPTKLFHECMKCGLIPLYVDPCQINVPEHLQRQILLSIALEARLIQFLGKCACDWATGSLSSAGCNLNLLLEWSWNRALVLKQNGDKLTIPLFNHLGDSLDRNSLQCLDNCVQQLGHVSHLYNIIIEKCSTHVLPEKKAEIMQRQKIIKIVSQYFQVIQWFVNVGLLPEFSMGQCEDITKDRLPYPIESLVKFYQNRRLKLHCLNGENPSVENLSNKSCNLLFIDEFIEKECAEHKLKFLWIEDESAVNGLYPPPSLHSLLKVYLIPEIKEEHKHSLVLYLLIDYAMTFDNKKYENIIHRLMQFPTMFGLSNTAIKVTQAFWHLDHRDFQLALNQLQSVLAGGCITQWQHNVVLASLLVQKKTQSALQYLHVRKPCTSLYDDRLISNSIYDDWDACSNLFLSRGLVYEAFNFNKESSKNLPAEGREERLKTFFESCKKMGVLPRILSLPLTSHEENTFVNFLKTFDNSYYNDILVLYYLNRTRYIEANQVNEELKRLTSRGQLPYDAINDFQMKKGYVYKTEARNQLVGLYCKTLPPITRHLAQFGGVPTVQKVVAPTPLTVNIQSIEQKSASYKSSFIQETIERASETWLRNSRKRAAQIEEIPFLCTPKIMKFSSKFNTAEKMSTTPDGTMTKMNSTNEIVENEIKIVNMSPKLKTEIEVLLHTPLVKRKSVDIHRLDSPLRFSERKNQRDGTPQSILKVRRAQSKLMSTPIDERQLAETDDELDAGSQYTQSDTLSRSIRFNIPKNGSPPSSECASDIHDSFYELCGHQAKYMTAGSLITQASPRKSIHETCSSCKSSPQISNKGKSLESSSSDDGTDYKEAKEQNDSLEGKQLADVILGKENSSLNNTLVGSDDVVEAVPKSRLSDSRLTSPSGSKASNSATLEPTVSSEFADDSILPSDISDVVSDASFSTFSKNTTSKRSFLIDNSTCDTSKNNVSIYKESITTEQSKVEVNVNTVTENCDYHSSFMRDLVMKRHFSEDMQDEYMSSDAKNVDEDDCNDVPDEQIDQVSVGNLEKIDLITPAHFAATENASLLPEDEATSGDQIQTNESYESQIVISFNEEECLVSTHQFNSRQQLTTHESSGTSEKEDACDIVHIKAEPVESLAISKRTSVSPKILPVFTTCTAMDPPKMKKELLESPESPKASPSTGADKSDLDSNNAKETKEIPMKTSPVAPPHPKSIDESSTNSDSVISNLATNMSTPKSKRAIQKTESENESRISSSRRSLRGSSKIDTLSTSSIESDQESTTSSQRKSRRSVFSIAKPNLSVIPEISHAEDGNSIVDKSNLSRNNRSSVIDVYSSTRRLTRHQRSLLEKSLEASENTTAVLHSASKLDTHYEDSDESNISHCSSLEQTLDPILLLDKPTFEGPPDLDERMNRSRESSVASDIPYLEKETKKRASSSHRELGTSVSASPVSEFESSRPRRQSFAKAIEAICTPKRNRRLSIDSKGEHEERCETPVSVKRSQTPLSVKRPETPVSIKKRGSKVGIEASAIKSLVEKMDAEAENEKLQANEDLLAAEKTSENMDTVAPLPRKSELETIAEVPRNKSRGKKALSVHGDLVAAAPSEDMPMPSKSAAKKRPPKKAASIHGQEPYKRLTRQSLIASPLSKEEMMSVNINAEPTYLRNRGTHKLVKPLKFDLRKK